MNNNVNPLPTDPADNEAADKVARALSDAHLAYCTQNEVPLLIGVLGAISFAAGMVVAAYEEYGDAIAHRGGLISLVPTALGTFIHTIAHHTGSIAGINITRQSAPHGTPKGKGGRVHHD